MLRWMVIALELVAAAPASSFQLCGSVLGIIAVAVEVLAGSALF